MGRFWESKLLGASRRRMSASAGQASARSAHVIVFGNEKGGTGKTTSAMHLAVHLLRSGFRVATIDLDVRQRSLTRYVQNRLNWSLVNAVELEMPSHFHFEGAQDDSVREAQAQDFSAFVAAVSEVERNHDFVIVDTPGSDSYLMRLAHSMADTLITPMNDSFVDLDVLGQVDARSLEVTNTSHYAATVRDARRKRYLADEGLLDWIVLRNRVSSLVSRNQLKLIGCLKELSPQLGFRIVDGIGERVMFREFYPMGLTALDDFDTAGRAAGATVSASHRSAREEVRKLASALRLPTDEAGHRRAETRKAWMSSKPVPIDTPDIVTS